MKLRGNREAFGAPGMPPRWTHSNKEAVGTAYSSDSKVWYTLWQGILTEVYYPTIDSPQIRDLEFLVTDHHSFFHEEKRHLESHVELLAPHGLAYRITNTDPEGRYRIVKEVMGHPHLSCVLLHCKLERMKGTGHPLGLYALLAPHLNVGGWGNTGLVIEAGGRELLAAEKDGLALVLGASVPYRKLSAGFVGESDGWRDLSENLTMDWEFDRATRGNVALIGRLAWEEAPPEGFTLALSFGHGLAHATSNLFQALGTPFPELKARFEEQWHRPIHKRLPLEPASGDRGHLYRASHALLLAHEDKTYPGAFIAALSIPWGASQSDENRGGYHLVWVRDLFHSASGLLASGDTTTPLRALIYLATSQQPDGGFPQNFWLNGTPYWTGVQLDEVAYPILLAWRLKRANALEGFDPYPMVLAAAGYLIRHGPATQQERWEETAGYSPSTLAVNIAALVGAASFARDHQDPDTATFLEEYADFLEQHVEAWTVTRKGTLVPGISRHYIRILPVDLSDPHPVEDPDQGTLALNNQPPGAVNAFRPSEIVDAGFLELVRFGVRSAHDPIVVDSVKVVDHVLKVETPKGPAWHRYNHDGFGQAEDGGPYRGYGKGRAWPLLTGERGHYELAAGRNPRPFLHAMERFSTRMGLLPEQVWDEPDLPGTHLRFGGPTGSAVPLMWAHAEYVTLLRSVNDGVVFDRIPEVEDRYVRHREDRPRWEVWKFNRQVSSVPRGGRLRVLAAAPFSLHWSMDGWRTVTDTEARATDVGMRYVDLEVPPDLRSPILFTFFWPEADRWEGRDFTVLPAGET
jgi:glucoamylase